MHIRTGRKHYPWNWTPFSGVLRCFLPALFIILICATPLWSSDADFGLGLGIYHAEIHSRGEMPDAARKESVFSTFMSFSAELGFRVSDRLKVSLKPYYHSRNYSYESRYGGDFQLYGHYLDIPFSLSTRIHRTEVFAGPSLGVLLGSHVLHDNDFNEPDGGWNDLQPIIPALHIGARLPANKSGSASMDVQYARDLIPFSSLWGRDTTQDRFAIHASYRFNRAPEGMGIQPDSLSLGLDGVNVGIGLGFHSQALLTEGVHSYQYDPSYRRGRFIPAIDLSIPISQHLGIGICASQNIRSYTIADYQSYRDLIFRAGYWDFPLLLSVQADGVEYAAGPNLGIRYFTHYHLESDGMQSLPAPESIKDAAKLIPGYTLHMRVPLKKASPWALNMMYSHDLQPFSRTHSLDKTQTRTAFYMSYRIGNNDLLTDLLPDAYQDKYPLQKSMNIGLAYSEVLGMKMWMPNMSTGKKHRFESGFGWGDSWFWGISVAGNTKEAYGITFTRCKYQLDISWRHRFTELFVAPGIGMDIGILSDNSPGAWFPLLPYGNLMLAREAGIRLHLSSRLALQASCEAINSVLFNDYPVFKLNLSFSR